MLHVRSFLVPACAAVGILGAIACGDESSSTWVAGLENDAALPTEDASSQADAVADSSSAGSGGSGQPDGGPESDASGQDADASPPPKPDAVAPCAQGSCWQTELYPNACGFAANDEDFSSGKYNVHAYATQVHGGSEMNLALTNSGGSWQPALILTKADGTVVYDGEVGLVENGLTVTQVTSGRTGGTAHFKVNSTTSWEGTLFVSGWSVVDSGFTEFLPADAVYHVESESVCAPPQPGQGTAPAGAIAGEQSIGMGSIDLSTAVAAGIAYRVDAKRGEHIGFRYDFTPTGADVSMEVLRWNGTAAVSMAQTDGGSGLRVLAVLDQVEDRTFWVRFSGAATTGTLVAKRTPFEEGAHCNADCATLLQFPLPIEPAQEGYDLSGATYREQFGRRDLLMFTRHAGRAIAAAKAKPFYIHDLSNWDGSSPPGHASHDLGKDIDYSIYNAAGNPVWTSVCTPDSEDNCLPGTGDDFGAEHMARLLAPVFESGRVQYAFLDEELHPALFAAAEALVAKGELDSSVIPVFKDVVSHWPNHHDHVHLRVYITDY